MNIFQRKLVVKLLFTSTRCVPKRFEIGAASPEIWNTADVTNLMFSDLVAVVLLLLLLLLVVGRIHRQGWRKNRYRYEFTFFFIKSVINRFYFLKRTHFFEKMNIFRNISIFQFKFWT
jgi:hypothetical protein